MRWSEVEGEYLIFADALRKQVGLGDNPVVAKIIGKELVGVNMSAIQPP